MPIRFTRGLPLLTAQPGPELLQSGAASSYRHAAGFRRPSMRRRFVTFAREKIAEISARGKATHPGRRLRPHIKAADPRPGGIAHARAGPAGRTLRPSRWPNCNGGSMRSIPRPGRWWISTTLRRVSARAGDCPADGAVRGRSATGVEQHRGSGLSRPAATCVPGRNSTRALRERQPDVRPRGDRRDPPAGKPRVHDRGDGDRIARHPGASARGNKPGGKCGETIVRGDPPLCQKAIDLVSQSV